MPYKPKNCICNHGNPADCYPKMRCACRVHGKFDAPKPSEEWEKEFDEKFPFAILGWDWKPNDKYHVEGKQKDHMKEIKSFIRTLRDQAFNEGYNKGLDRGSVNCKEHCDKAVEDYKDQFDPKE